MNIELLDGKAVVVQDGEQTWLLGCPAGIGASLKEAGIMPTAVLLTRVSAPGLAEIDGKPIVVRADPLHIGNLEAKPTSRTHGWDYAIKDADGTAVLWTERGDVSARDVAGYALAIVGNKHRSDAFGENVITRPWPEEAHYVVSAGTWMAAEKMIRHEGDKWVIYSKDGEKKLGEYDTEEEAKERLRQIEFFKHQGKAEDEPKSDEDEPEDDDEEEAKKAVRETTNTLRVRVANPDDFENFATITLDEEKGIQAVIGRKKGKKVTSTQAYIFDKDKWSEEEAQAWVDAHKGKKAKKEMPDWAPSELQTSAFVLKEEADGRWRWFMHTANDTLDLQKEVVTPEAIDWSLALAAMMDNKGPLLFRHLPIPVGRCDKQVRVGPMLFESGLLDPIDKNPVVKAVIELVEREPGRWRASPGLRFKQEDLVDGVYRRCWIAERSITPQPANLTTAFAVTRQKDMAQVTDEMLREAAEQLGLPFEQIKALAQRYLDTQKEFNDVDGLLVALKEGVKAGLTAQPDAPPTATLETVPGPDWEKIIGANTAAMNSLALALKELAAGKFVDGQVHSAIEEYLAQAPRFGSQAKGIGEGDEETVKAALKAMEARTDQRSKQTHPFPDPTAFERMFDSRILNS